MPDSSEMPILSPPGTSPGTGVVVTGGASGIGLASAEALAAVGRPIAIWDIDMQRAEQAAVQIAGRYGVPVIGLAVDVRNPAAIREASERTIASLPTVGGFVHSAGIGDSGGIAGFDPQAWDSAMSIHVRPILLIAQALMDALRRQPGSAIVALSSMQADLGDGRLPTYTAAKGAVRSLVHSMADALAADGIRINSVSPGMIRTPMLEKAMPQGPLHDATIARIMLQRFGDPAEIGRVVRFLMSDEASYVTGTDLLADGGYTASTRRHPPTA